MIKSAYFIIKTNTTEGVSLVITNLIVNNNNIELVQVILDFITGPAFSSEGALSSRDTCCCATAQPRS